jgi:hypothetical protein
LSDSCLYDGHSPEIACSVTDSDTAQSGICAKITYARHGSDN